MSTPAEPRTMRLRASVLIPAYNAEDFIAEAVASSLNQSQPPLEVIVIDDGSRDATAARAREAGAIVVTQPNAGQATARNHGASIAGGDVLVFLDADDRMLEHRISLQIAALSRDARLLGVCGNLQVFQEVDTHEGDTREVLGPPSPGLVCGTLAVRADGYRSTGGMDPDRRTSEFIEWVGRCRRRGLHIEMLDEVLVQRRAHASNMSRDRAALAADLLVIARQAIIDRRSPGS